MQRVALLLVLNLLQSRASKDAEVSCVFMESCILPCSFQKGGDLVIHWVLVPGDIPVHSFFSNKDHLASQNKSFRSRTSLFNDQLSTGNTSLLLTGVTVQDERRYNCYTSNTAGSKTSFINLKVDAPVRKVHIQRVENRMTCSSEGLYPKPELTWTTSPRSNETFQNRTTVQKSEQQLYSISGALEDAAPDLDYSCTVRTPMSQRRASWSRPTFVNSSDAETTTITCRSSNRPATGLVWRFNHSQVVLNWTGSNSTVSEEWRPHVKDWSESGHLTLKDLTPEHEGIYSCELRDAEETFMSSFVLTLEESPDSHNNDAAIAGGVVGAILVLGLIAAVAIYCKRKRRTQTDDQRANGGIPEAQEMMNNVTSNGSGDQNMDHQRGLEAEEETSFST